MSSAVRPWAPEGRRVCWLKIACTVDRRGGGHCMVNCVLPYWVLSNCDKNGKRLIIDICRSGQDLLLGCQNAGRGGDQCDNVGMAEPIGVMGAYCWFYSISDVDDTLACFVNQRCEPNQRFLKRSLFRNGIRSMWPSNWCPLVPMAEQWLFTAHTAK